MTELIDSFSRIVSIIVAFVGVVGALYIVYGAYQYMSAGGNPSKAESGKSAIIQAGVGIVIALVAFALVNALTSQIGDSAGAVQVQQVVGIDSQRLEAPRVTSVELDKGCIVVRFTEAVIVGGAETDGAGLKLGTEANGSLDLSGYSDDDDGDDGALDLKFNSQVTLPAPIIVTGFIFTKGSTIKDNDGNNALYAFQPYTTNAEIGTAECS